MHSITWSYCHLVWNDMCACVGVWARIRKEDRQWSLMLFQAGSLPSFSSQTVRHKQGQLVSIVTSLQVHNTCVFQSLEDWGNSLERSSKYLNLNLGSVNSGPKQITCYQLSARTYNKTLTCANHLCSLQMMSSCDKSKHCILFYCCNYKLFF